MSYWTDITTLGTGTVDFRLMVEGWPHEWVTNVRITHGTNKNGRTVYPGLQYKGLRIAERMILEDGWPDVSGMTVTITPTDDNEDTLNSFTRDSQKIGQLAADIDEDDATWTTLPATLSAGVYHLATEAVLCDGSNGITRAYWNTVAQQHVTEIANRANPVPIYSWPPTMEGRRAYLYAYGTSDDPAGDGNIVWRGIVARPPRMAGDGVSWTIELRPITTVFDQNVGGGSAKEYRVRGVYHSNQCPMFISIGVGYEGVPGSNGEYLFISGFFETQDAWVAHVNTELASTMVGITDVDAVIYGYGYFGGPRPYVQIVASGSSVVHVLIKDVLDGDLPISAQGNSRAFNVARNIIEQGDASGSFVVQGTTHQPPWEYPLPESRTMVGSPLFDALGYNGPFGYRPYEDITFPTDGYPSDGGDPAGDWPSNRVYLESVEGLEVGDVLLVKESADFDKTPQLLEITAIDGTDRYITVTVGPEPIYVSSEQTLVKVAGYPRDNDVAGFIQDVVNKSPQANTGETPFITANDVDATQWNDYYLNNPVPVYWRHRSYQFVSPTKVKDIVMPELQVAGLMARLDAAGRVSIAQMPFVSPSRSAAHTLTDDDILFPSSGSYGAWPTWEAQRDGLINIVHLRLGYSPYVDDFDERFDFLLRNTASISEHKSGDKAKKEIAPRSTPTSGGSAEKRLADLPPPESLVDMVAPYLQTLSKDYAMVTVAVPFTKFGILVGDIVSITSAYLPNGQGGRGVTAKKAICVAREWDLDPASNRMGKLTFWFPRDSGRTAGYAPTGRVTAQSNTSGNVWLLTFDPANGYNIAWSEDGDGNVVKHFAVDDSVEILRVNVTSENRVVGVVTGVPSATQIEVTFAATWTPSTHTWNLRFVRSESVPAGDRQDQYCWVADSNGTGARSFL